MFERTRLGPFCLASALTVWLAGCGSAPPRDDAAAIKEALARLPQGSTAVVTTTETNWPTFDNMDLREYQVEARVPGAQFVVDMRVSLYVRGWVSVKGYFQNADSRGGKEAVGMTPADETTFVAWYNTTGRKRLRHIFSGEENGRIVWTIYSTWPDPDPLRVTLDPATHTWTPVPPRAPPESSDIDGSAVKSSSGNSLTLT